MLSVSDLGVGDAPEVSSYCLWHNHLCETCDRAEPESAISRIGD